MERAYGDESNETIKGSRLVCGNDIRQQRISNLKKVTILCYLATVEKDDI